MMVMLEFSGYSFTNFDHNVNTLSVICLFFLSVQCYCISAAILLITKPQPGKQFCNDNRADHEGKPLHQTTQNF